MYVKIFRLLFNISIYTRKIRNYLFLELIENQLLRRPFSIYPRKIRNKKSYNLLIIRKLSKNVSYFSSLFR